MNKKTYLILEKIISYHNYLYYILDCPLISDVEYDFLLKKLYQIKKNHVVLCDNINNKVFNIHLSQQDKLRNHIYPMLSLKSIFNINDFIHFYKKINDELKMYGKINFFCELKFDGLALSLLYRKGIFIRALTRGDGLSGEDVTENARVVNNIPTCLNHLNHIPDILEVRGEVCMLKKDFEILNVSLLKNKKKIFSNARNAAAGSLRQKNPMVTKQRKLFFYCYSVKIFDHTVMIHNHSDKLQFLYKLGFSISQYVVLSSNLHAILDFYYLIDKVRNFFSFNIDGIVIKVNSIYLQKILGCTNKYPKWAIALKFLDHEVITQLINIHYQVGRTGIVTPVADVKPVVLSGVVIKKASLYNKHEMYKLDLHMYDTVIIKRMGDVIPRIKSVILEKRFMNSKKILFKKFCPSCNSLLYNYHNKYLIQCMAGLNCVAQCIKNIEHFFSQYGLYVLGFGIKIIKKLFYNNYIQNVIDCFKLDVMMLCKLKLFGYKSAIKLVYKIEQCKYTTLSKFIYALGIENIGLENAHLIAKHFQSIKQVMLCTLDQLRNIKNIGDINANIFFNFMKDKNNLLYINKLINNIGIKFNNDIMAGDHINNKILWNKKIVLTGKFINFTRKEIINHIINMGGIVCSTLSKILIIYVLVKILGTK